MLHLRVRKLFFLCEQKTEVEYEHRTYTNVMLTTAYNMTRWKIGKLQNEYYMQVHEFCWQVLNITQTGILKIHTELLINYVVCPVRLVYALAVKMIVTTSIPIKS